MVVQPTGAYIHGLFKLVILEFSIDANRFITFFVSHHLVKIPEFLRPSYIAPFQACLDQLSTRDERGASVVENMDGEVYISVHL